LTFVLKKNMASPLIVKMPEDNSDDLKTPTVKMPVLLQSTAEAAAPGATAPASGSAAAAAGGVMVGIIILIVISMAIPITLTVFAAKRNQPGTAHYKLMCVFLVLMWCSGIIFTPFNRGLAVRLGGLGGFAGFVGTCVMVHKGGGCGGGGCKPGQSAEELLRSLGSMVESVAGSSMTSF
jgi:hypothetical protein